MKATFVASVLAFSALAVAAPNGGKKDWCKNGNYKKGEIKGDYDGYCKLSNTSLRLSSTDSFQGQRRTTSPRPTLSSLHQTR